MEQQPGERRLAVFDLDGTLADVAHRLHFLEPPRRDWNGFFRAASGDPPLAEGIALALRWAETCDLGYVTGRPERCRRATERWLRERGLPAAPLWMRPDRDRRPARVLKPELLADAARTREIAVVVDDDAQVCAAYRARSLPVVHATWAAASRALERAQEETGRT
ncbi:hypothetical protein GCM10009801_65250 [Streptomyces albiaxialis]|uniref:Polynucleotide kinase PNKP phosphatase domain-containing protein n=1 Tax=Streptomyces albiaxialis TaxID=329523 RepID=A0ABN2WRA3_9ACTN